MGSLAKSYMSKGFLVYEEIRKYSTTYEEAVSHMWLCNRSLLNFLINEENLIFFFISVPLHLCTNRGGIRENALASDLACRLKIYFLAKKTLELTLMPASSKSAKLTSPKVAQNSDCPVSKRLEKRRQMRQAAPRYRISSSLHSLTTEVSAFHTHHTALYIFSLAELRAGKELAEKERIYKWRDLYPLIVYTPPTPPPLLPKRKKTQSNGRKCSTFSIYQFR